MLGPLDSFRMGAGHAKKTNHEIRMLRLLGRWHQPDLQGGEGKLDTKFNHTAKDSINYAYVIKFQ